MVFLTFLIAFLSIFENYGYVYKKTIEFIDFQNIGDDICKKNFCLINIENDLSV